jgi:hypothetical protein
MTTSLHVSSSFMSATSSFFCLPENGLASDPFSFSVICSTSTADFMADGEMVLLEVVELKATEHRWCGVEIKAGVVAAGIMMT